MPVIVDTSPAATGHDQIILDPSEISTGRVELDISNFIKADGVDWGDAAIEAYMAEASVGQLPVDFRIPNRIVQIPLVLTDTRPGIGFDAIRQALQAKAALFHRERGWVKRETTIAKGYLDVVNATLHLGASALTNIRSFDVDATLQLECVPEFYGDEIGLLTHSETTNPELIFTETGIRGNYPARARLIVTDASGVNQQGLIAAVRSRNYDSAATAALAYEAEAMTLATNSSIVTATGASGGGTNNAVQNATILSFWTTVLTTDLVSGGPLTHKGSYKVLARCRSTSTVPARIRFAWGVGDLLNTTENDATTLTTNPPSGSWDIADLGTVRLDPTPSGTHRWKGQVQAISDSGTASLTVDRLWFVPVDEFFGKVTAESNIATEFSVIDGFDQGAGNLTGNTLPSGQTWLGAGDPDDWTVGTGVAKRFAGTDVSPGRAAIAGATAFTNVTVSAVFTADLVPQNYALGLLARYVDISNWLLAYFDNGPRKLTVIKKVAGVTTTLASTDAHTVGSYTITLSAYTDGSFIATIGTVKLTGQDSALATGGALATGATGFLGQAPSTALTMNVDNFTVGVPVNDAVLFASLSSELRYDGHIRESASGVFSPTAQPVGDLFRLPPSGMEGRTVQVFVKDTRGNFGSVADTAIDDISAQIKYRPCWLFLPESASP